MKTRHQSGDPDLAAVETELVDPRTFIRLRDPGQVTVLAIVPGTKKRSWRLLVRKQGHGVRFVPLVTPPHITAGRTEDCIYDQREVGGFSRSCFLRLAETSHGDYAKA